ncbi:hypothetical protein HMPREF1990_00746 [Porphyromonas gingivalis W4087]|nr:hypothetical protein HMPREF1990_00746 [Porphyromonas gingivalis W4087]
MATKILFSTDTSPSAKSRPRGLLRSDAPQEEGTKPLARFYSLTNNTKALQPSLLALHSRP